MPKRHFKDILNSPKYGDVKNIWDEWISAGVAENELSSALLELGRPTHGHFYVEGTFDKKRARRFADRLRKDADIIQHLQVKFSKAVPLGPRGGPGFLGRWRHDIYRDLPNLLREFAKEIAMINYREHKGHKSKEYYKQAMEEWIVTLRQQAPKAVRPALVFQQAAALINFGYSTAEKKDRIAEVDAEALQKRLDRSSIIAHLQKYRGEHYKPESGESM